MPSASVRRTCNPSVKITENKAKLDSHFTNFEVKCKKILNYLSKWNFSFSSHLAKNQEGDTFNAIYVCINDYNNNHNNLHNRVTNHIIINIIKVKGYLINFNVSVLLKNNLTTIIYTVRQFWWFSGSLKAKTKRNIKILSQV